MFCYLFDLLLLWVNAARSFLAVVQALAIHYAKSVPKLLFARHKIFILSRMTFMTACHRRTCRQRFTRARAHARRFAVTFALVCTNRTKVLEYQHLQVCR